MTNIIDCESHTTIAVVVGSKVQRLNPFTVLVNGILIEFRGQVILEDLDLLENSLGSAEPTNGN